MGTGRRHARVRDCFQQSKMRKHLLRPCLLKRCIMKNAVYLSALRKDLKKDFKNLNIDTKDVDCIIMEVLNCDFSFLLKDQLLTTEEIKHIMEAVKLRKEGKPVTKIFNKAYFYGYQFYIDENVLSPRSETEILVDKALEVLKSMPNAKVLDLCTGSGCIACAIKKECLKREVNATITAVDISKTALEVAKRNAKTLNLDIKFLESDVFKNVNEKFDVIISNPPYIEEDTWRTLSDEVRVYDPKLALVGGADGLDFYREIKRNMDKLNKNGVLLLEIGFNQAEKIKDIFSDYCVKIIKDYSNNDRVVIIN